MVPGSIVVQPLKWSSIMNKVAEEIHENSNEIQSIEENIEDFKDANNIMDQGKKMVKDLNHVKDFIFSDEGKNYIKEGKAIVKKVGALTDTGLNTIGSESAQFSKPTKNILILLLMKLLIFFNLKILQLLSVIMILELFGSIGGGYYAYQRLKSQQPKSKNETNLELREVCCHKAATQEAASSRPNRLRGVCDADEP